MLKKIYLLFLTVSIVLMSTACENLLDVNEDPARISPEQTTLQTLLPAGIRFTASAFFGAAQYGSLYPQYTAGQQIDQYTPYGMDQLWRPFYLDVLPTLSELINNAEDIGARNYSGVAKALLGLNLMMVSDTWGDAPYSEANQGSERLYPCYDPMQEIYGTHLKALFDGAIADLQAPLPELPTVRNIQNDYVFNGDREKWLKVAYGARARYHLHLARRNPSLLQNAIEDARRAIDNPTGEDDLQLAYDQQIQNPWFSFLGNSPNRIMRPSSYIMGLMNGTGKYQGITDPRISSYADNGSEDGDGPYIGTTPGRDVNEEPGVNVHITTNTWFGRDEAPIQMLTYVEMQFILAEALLSDNPTEAYQAYLAGIEGSMVKLGLDQAEIDSYLMDPAISVGADNLTLSDIMVQKYIGLYLQIETWTDLRRHQYDPSLYVGIEPPVVNQIDNVNRPWVQRANIADDEPGRNTCLPEIGNQAQRLWLFE